MLVAFAARAARCLRSGDLLGRLGGEEFAVFIANCVPAVAGKIAERIREEMADAPVRLRDGRSVSVTLSVGMVTIATATGAKQGLEHWLGAADAALYRAKNSGRNRLEAVVWREGG